MGASTSCPRFAIQAISGHYAGLYLGRSAVNNPMPMDQAYLVRSTRNNATIFTFQSDALHEYNDGSVLSTFAGYGGQVYPVSAVQDGRDGSIFCSLGGVAGPLYCAADDNTRGFSACDTIGGHILFVGQTSTPQEQLQCEGVELIIDCLN